MSRHVAFVFALVLGCAHTDPSVSGREALSRGDYAAARRELAQAVDQHPEDSSLWRDLARAHFRDGAMSEARVAVARSDQLKPGHTGTILLRAQIKMAQADRKGAHVDATFVAKQTKIPRELQEVAVLFVRLGEADPAIAALERAVKASGGEAAAYTNLAVLATELRKLEVASAAFDEGIREHPDDVPLAQAYAAFLVQVGDLDKARTIYTAMLPHHPKPGLIHLAIALLSHEGGDLEKARHHAGQAVELEGNERPDVHFTYVVVLRDSGDKPAAQKALRRALRRFPAHDGLLSLQSGL